MKFLIGLLFVSQVFASTFSNNTSNQFFGAFYLRNYVVNPAAEKNSTDGVTVSGATKSRNTTTPIDGVADFSITLANNATDKVTWAVGTLTSNELGSSCELRAKYTASSIGSVVRFAVLVGAVVQTSTVPLAISSVAQTVSLTVPCANTTTIQLYNDTGNTGTSALKVDNLYFGPATGIANIQPGSPGQIFYTGASTCPSGSLLADGSAVSRTTYSALFSAVSTTYGVGDGSTTFNVPNGKGVFVRGAGSQTISGTSFSASLGTYQTDAFQGHRHQGYGDTLTFSGSANPVLGGNSATNQSGNNFIRDPIADASGNGTPRISSETRPANFAATPCIWYTGSQVAITNYQTPKISTFTRYLSASGTYTTPIGAIALRIKMTGQGGGGGGSTTTAAGNAGAGAAGNSSTFGGILQANGGSGGGANSNYGGAGGTCSISAPAITIVSQQGGTGSSGGNSAGLNTGNRPGGSGGVNSFGGGGGGGTSGNLAGVGNSGGGGGGAESPSSGNSGSGGGASCYLEVLIPNPASSYAYVAASASSNGGSAGTGGSAGGLGAPGQIIIEEIYSTNAPFLVGSVTSNSTGAERIERATVTMTSGASCTVNSQSGSWITATTPVVAGSCTFTITGFSGTPSCSGGTYGGMTAGTELTVIGFRNVSSTSVRVDATDQNSGTNSAYTGLTSIICMGPR